MTEDDCEEMDWEDLKDEDDWENMKYRLGEAEDLEQFLYGGFGLYEMVKSLKNYPRWGENTTVRAWRRHPLKKMWDVRVIIGPDGHVTRLYEQVGEALNELRAQLGILSEEKKEND